MFRTLLVSLGVTLLTLLFVRYIQREAVVTKSAASHDFTVTIEDGMLTSSPKVTRLLTGITVNGVREHAIVDDEQIAVSEKVQDSIIHETFIGNRSIVAIREKGYYRATFIRCLSTAPPEGYDLEWHDQHGKIPHLHCSRPECDDYYVGLYTYNNKLHRSYLVLTDFTHETHSGKYECRLYKGDELIHLLSVHVIGTDVAYELFSEDDRPPKMEDWQAIYYKDDLSDDVLEDFFKRGEARLRIKDRIRREAKDSGIEVEEIVEAVHISEAREKARVARTMDL